MSRPKEVWEARQKGRVVAERRSVVVPAVLKDDPDRTILVSFPRSEAERVILAQINVLESIDQKYGEPAPFNGQPRKVKRAKKEAGKRREAVSA